MFRFAQHGHFRLCSGLPQTLYVLIMRHYIRNEIESIIPLDALEEAHLLDALRWIDSGAPLLRTEKPATPPKHLVSYFVLMDASHILLVDHRSALLWLPPGGHVELGESPRETVVRELNEELGLSVTLAEIQSPRMITVSETVGLTALHVDVSLWYVLKVNRSAKITFDHEEFNSVKWFAFGEIPFERAEPNLRRFMKKLSWARL
jgi:8-oxo-dGTP diphosphatase